MSEDDKISVILILLLSLFLTSGSIFFVLSSLNLTR